MVVYSLTKYMNGHADVVMGAAILNDDELYEELKFFQNGNFYISTRALFGHVQNCICVMKYWRVMQRPVSYRRRSIVT